MFVVYETYKIDEPHKNYIGKTSKDKIEKGYVGSGKRLKYAISKYGDDKFITRILKEFEIEDDAYIYESQLTPHICGYYNIAVGGRGGQAGLKQSDIHKKRKNESLRGRKVSKKTREKLREAWKKRKDIPVHSSQGRKQISERQRKENNPNWCGVSTEDMKQALLQYHSFVAAGKELGISWQTIPARFKNEGICIIYNTHKYDHNKKVIGYKGLL